MGKPSAPTPPNPILTGAAQTNSNVATGVSNAFLNNINQQTPTGNLNYDVTGSYAWQDPLSGATYSIPRFTASQTLAQPGSPYYAPQQNNLATQYNTSEIGKKLSWDLMNQANNNQLTVDPNNDPYAYRGGDWLDQQWTGGNAPTTFGDAGSQRTDLGYNGQQQMGFDQTGMPIQNSLGNTGSQVYSFGDFGGPQYGYDPAGQQQTSFGGTQRGVGYTFDDAGNITRSYGDNSGVLQDRSNVESALFQRLQPQLDQQRNQLEQRLADQGIAYGSPAYDQAMDQLNRSQNDARLAVTAQGGQEQKLQEDIMAQRAGFQNAAQMQAYQQAQGRGQFANQAQQQEFAQQAARGTFANTAQAEANKQSKQQADMYNQAQQQRYAQLLGQGQFYNQAQQTAYQQALQSGQFNNAAEAQAFAEAKARGDFANAAEAEQYKQALQSGQFANQAQTQNFQQQALRGQFAQQGQAAQFGQQQSRMNAGNAARANWLQEQYDRANQGINQITSLLSGSQVSKPSYVTPTNNQIANTDIAGIINSNFNQNLAQYNAQNNQFQQLTGGLLGGLAGILSDEREKNVGDKMGTIFAANDENETKALPVYEFSYKDDPAATRHVGPMAQDVEKINPRAVRTVGGRKYIDATRMGSIMRPYVAKKAA